MTAGSSAFVHAFVGCLLTVMGASNVAASVVSPQTPCSHATPDGQTWPQLPQLLGSVPMSKHLPRHTSRPILQMHMPLVCASSHAQLPVSPQSASAVHGSPTNGPIEACCVAPTCSSAVRPTPLSGSGGAHPAPRIDANITVDGTRPSQLAPHRALLREFRSCMEHLHPRAHQVVRVRTSAPASRCDFGRTGAHMHVTRRRIVHVYAQDLLDRGEGRALLRVGHDAAGDRLGHRRRLRAARADVASAPSIVAMRFCSTKRDRREDARPP